MTWLLTFVVGFLTAVAGCFGAGLLGGICVDWFRIPSREGASGFYTILFCLVGIMGGFVIGLVSARIVAGGENPGFLKAFGMALCTAFGLLVLATFVAWLKADFPPSLEGKTMVVEVELRLPSTVTLPAEQDRYGYAWGISLTADTGGRSQRVGPMRTSEAVQAEGRWLIPAKVYLHTSDPGKSLGVMIGDGETHFFRLALPSKPTRANMNWSEWVTESHFGKLKQVPPAEAIAMRYRVQFFVPPPPEPPRPSEKEIDAQAVASEDAGFAALTPASSLDAWLSFTDYSKPQARREAAAAAIAQRPEVIAEMSAAIRSENNETANLASRAVALMKEPPAGLGPAVADLGRKIADQIREANAISVESDPSPSWSQDVLRRFVSWHEAARVLQGRSGVDMKPAMQEFHELARVRPDGDFTRDVVRVSAYYINQWSEKSAPAGASK